MFFDGRAESSFVIFWFERLFDELRDPNVRKEAPKLSGNLRFLRKLAEKVSEKRSSLKFQRVNFKGVCILTSEDLRTSSGTGVFAEKRFRLLFWGVKRIQRTHSEIQRLMGCQLSGSWWQVGESL